MPSRKISLEYSAYAKLRDAKRPGESFTDVVNRLLRAELPSLSVFAGLLKKKKGEELAKVVQRMRDEDLEAERKRLKASKRRWA